MGFMVLAFFNSVLMVMVMVTVTVMLTVMVMVMVVLILLGAAVREEEAGLAHPQTEGWRGNPLGGLQRLQCNLN